MKLSLKMCAAHMSLAAFVLTTNGAWAEEIAPAKTHKAGVRQPNKGAKPAKHEEQELAGANAGHGSDGPRLRGRGAGKTIEKSAFLADINAGNSKSSDLEAVMKQTREMNAAKQGLRRLENEAQNPPSIGQPSSREACRTDGDCLKGHRCVQGGCS
ncbi:MAG: hypothetical protein ACXU7X_11700 [Croceibacterium sp.]